MTVQELNKYIINKLETNRKERVPFRDYLKDFFSDYQSHVKELEHFNSSGRNFPSLIDMVNKMCWAILNCLEAYDNDDIATAIDIIRNMLNDYTNYLRTFVINNETNRIWYRMRSLEPSVKRYYAKDMFHVPFSKRGKIGNQRFSISGYPCLYLGKSVWSCWEELHEPNMNCSCVSRIEAIGELELLDLSWPIDKESDEDINSNFKLVCTWPLIIACSIRTLYTQESFKPEYIIPQLVMISIKKDNNYLGCAYTSTQRNDYFCWGRDLLLNVAIPVVKVDSQNELCSVLTSKFLVTDSTKGEYIWLEGETSSSTYYGDVLCLTANDNYKGSVFGNIEDEFERKNELKAYKL